MKYFIFKHGKYGYGSKDWGEEIPNSAYENNFCFSQFEYGFQRNSTTTNNWKVLKEVKVGDIIILSRGDLKYAWGYAIKPRFENKDLYINREILNCSEMISTYHDNYKYRSDSYNGYIEFEDCECFYENLEDGKNEWGQRIDIDKWRDYNREGINCKLIYKSKSPPYNTIQDITEEDALNIVRKLKNDPNFEFEDKSMENYIELLKSNKNLILTGAPGTGKTYLAKQVASKIILNKDYDESVENDINFKEQCAFVQFHPSYDYTDFVEGLRPKNDNGNIGFERKDGVFKEFCKEALNNQSSNFVFIIDEINRGEISKIFGELFFSVDSGYRGEKGKVQTQYANLIEDGDEFKDGFYIPENVYIIGTMNDIDRSVESMDFAMRRRFAWKEIKAEDTQNMLDEYKWENQINGDIIQSAKEKMNKLNEAISNTPELSDAYNIGASYFLKLDNYYNGDKNKAFEDLWKNHLEGLLFEYTRGMPKQEEIMENFKKAYYSNNTKTKNNNEEENANNTNN